MYLDCLSYRFGRRTTTASAGSEKNRFSDAAFVFKVMLESVRKSYERRVGEIVPFVPGFLVAHRGQSKGIAEGQCPISDPELQVLYENATINYEDT